MVTLNLQSLKGARTMNNEMSFKQSMKRIDEILELLEKNEIELEEAMKLFEEGLQLVNQCDAQLKSFKDKMNELVSEYEGDNHE